jgi:hypothetical protein
MARHTIEVIKVLDRWLAPDHRYFKVMGDDDATYIIRHDPETGEWGLVFYKAAGLIAGKTDTIGNS